MTQSLTKPNAKIETAFQRDFSRAAEAGRRRPVLRLCLRFISDDRPTMTDAQTLYLLLPEMVLIGVATLIYFGARFFPADAAA